MKKAKDVSIVGKNTFRTMKSRNGMNKILISTLVNMQKRHISLKSGHS